MALSVAYDLLEVHRRPRGGLPAGGGVPAWGEPQGCAVVFRSRAGWDYPGLFS